MKQSNLTLYKASTLLIVVALNAGAGAPASAQASGLTNGLPPTTMDSFVYEAKDQAEHIYGDEGSDGLPPYFGFDYVHRINNGISGQRDAGLTTGHGSYLPSAWGADEFIAPPGEMSQSGTNGGNPQLNNADATLNTEDQLEATSASGGGTPSNTAAYGPSPGPGWYPVVGCGNSFLGWMPPDLATLGASNWPAALAAFLVSSNFVGDPLEAQYELGQIWDQTGGQYGANTGF
ncbi:MAG TPA: hypothetical protein V6C69_00760 [Trichormus sp.]